MSLTVPCEKGLAEEGFRLDLRHEKDQTSPPGFQHQLAQRLQPRDHCLYLLKLMDTLFYTADRGQCAERLGVHAPEAVLPADLEEGYNPTFLWRREYHMNIPCYLP